MASTSSLFELEQIEVENNSIDAALIFEEIHKEIGDYLVGGLFFFIILVSYGKIDNSSGYIYCAISIRTLKHIMNHKGIGPL